MKKQANGGPESDCIVCRLRARLGACVPNVPGRRNPAPRWRARPRPHRITVKNVDTGLTRHTRAAPTALTPSWDCPAPTTWTQVPGRSRSSRSPSHRRDPEPGETGDGHCLGLGPAPAEVRPRDRTNYLAAADRDRPQLTETSGVRRPRPGDAVSRSIERNTSLQGVR